METTGKISNVTRDWHSNKLIVSLELDANPTEELQTLMNENLDIKIGKHRERRSLNANRLLWECIRQIAVEMRTDKWSVYLKLLRDYGEYTYICVPPGAVPMVRRQWRECEEIGEIDIHGRKAVQMICYYGSSTYDSKQFSVLLDGTKTEMEQIGLTPPPSEHMRRVIEAWEKDHDSPDSDSACVSFAE